MTQWGQGCPAFFFTTGMVMELRYYQQECVEAIYRFLRERAGNPCAVLPTGAGKTPVIATLCRDAVVRWNGRVLVVSHVKELLEQSARHIQELCPTIKVGLYSAGLKQRDTANSIIVAGIQSIYDKADQLGSFDLIIIDEAHLIPASGDGMYRQLIVALQEINPDIRIIGLTATPFRLDTGAICSEDGILNSICYEVGIRPLIAQGYLSKLVGKAGTQSVDTRHLKVVRGEYDQEQTEKAFDFILDAAIQEIIEKTLCRKSVLIFCQSIAHAERVAAALRDKQRGIFRKGGEELNPARSLFDLPTDPIPVDVNRVAADWLEEREHPVEHLRFCLDNLYSVGEIYGHTKDRDPIVKAFREGKLKYLVNVNVLTVGFDARNVDCVVLLRSTVSGGLFYQMVGRGFRVHEGKADCLILDYGGNLLRHGPVDLIKPKMKATSSGTAEPAGKVCPACQTVNGSRSRLCVDCGHEFESESTTQLNPNADDTDPISPAVTLETLPVDHVTYHVHTKRGADENTPKTLRVDYHLDLASVQSEWVCVEHTGFAFDKACRWWAKRCQFPMPDTAVEAVQYAEHGLLANTLEIEIKKKRGDKFAEIVRHELEEKPTGIEPCPECGTVNLRCLVPCDPPHQGKIVCGMCNHFYKWASKGEVDHYGFFDGAEDYKGLIPIETPVYEVPEDCPF